MKTLKDLFWDELMDIYDAEHQLVKALPKLAAAATCKHLNQALLAPLQQTEGHITQIEAVFTTLGETANGNTCEATQGMLEEGDGIIAEYQGSPAINAALICAAQKVEHYEIATYGCLHEWAGLLGHHEGRQSFQNPINHHEHTLQTTTQPGQNRLGLALARRRSPAFVAGFLFSARLHLRPQRSIFDSCVFP